MRTGERTLFLARMRVSRGASAGRSRLGALGGAAAAVVLVAQLVAPALVGAQLVAPGSLDTTFGGDGAVNTAVSPFHDFAEAVVVQPDDKLVAAGAADAIDPSVEFDRDFALVRYNADGSLDTAFGSDGTATVDFYGEGIVDGDQVRALILQPDGKLVAAGEVRLPTDPTTGTQADFGLARFNADGSLDTTFGVGGRATVDVGGGDQLAALARQSDGKLVVAGRLGAGGIGLARFNADGSLDTTFGTGGRVATNAGGMYEANAVAVQTDGKMVVAGTARLSDPRYQGIALARFDADGTFDTTFGTGGVVVTYYPGGVAGGRALLIRPDGTLVVGGSAAVREWTGIISRGQPALVRYLPNGSLDWTFGFFGWAVTDVNGVANALAEQPDGRIAAALGSGGSGPVLARYNSNGALDTSFGNRGLVTADDATAEAFVRQADGKLVTAGFVGTVGPNGWTYRDFALRRFNA